MELEFGKTPIGEIVKTLRRLASQGRFVVVANESANGFSYSAPARIFLVDVRVVLTYRRDGRRVFSLATWDGTRVEIIDLLGSLDLEAKRRNLLLVGNCNFFRKQFGEIKVQE